MLPKALTHNNFHYVNVKKKKLNHYFRASSCLITHKEQYEQREYNSRNLPLKLLELKPANTTGGIFKKL